MKALLQKIWKISCWVVGALVVLHVAVQTAESFFPHLASKFIFKLFDLGLEQNVPTFFAVALFILLALVVAFVGANKEKGKRWKWYLLSGICIFLGVDELAQFHEQISGSVQLLLDTHGFLAFAWVIPYAIAVLIIAIIYIPFILKLSPKVRKYIFIGGGFYVFGALLLEMVGAKLFDTHEGITLSYVIVSTFEEISEFLGLLLVLKGFVLYISEEEGK